jgi:hypothetical protein
MLRTKRTGLVLAGAIALAGAACGGGGNCGSNAMVTGPVATACEPAPPTPPPPPVSETVVIYQNNGPVAAESGVYIDFAIPSAGTVAATVDWTFASSQVAIAMTTGPCDDPFLGQCSHIGPMNITRSLKPKTVSGPVSQAGTGRLWILNLATVDESMAVQITLTRTRSASAPVILEPFARSWVPVPNAAVRAVRALQNQNY